MYVPQILYAGGVGWLGPSNWFGLQSRPLCGAVCALSIVNITFISSSIISLLNLFLDFSCFYMFLSHDYNLCFHGSPCYTASYCNYKSV